MKSIRPTDALFSMRMRFAALLAAGYCALALPARAGDARVIGLHDAEDIAVGNSFDLRSLRMERAIANETLDARFRDFFPSLSLSYRRNRVVAPRNFDNGTHSVQVSVSQPVYDGGRTSLSYEIAEIDVALARERFEEQSNQLLFQVREAYLRLLQERENISIAEASLASAAQALRRSRVERRQGVVTELDFREIETEHERRVLELRQQKDAYRDGLEDFRLQLRLPQDEAFEISRLDLLELKINELELSAEEIYQLALENRSDVRQARIDLMRSRKEYLLAKYDWLPTVSLTGSYGRTGEEWPPTNTEWSVGVNFTVRAFGHTVNSDVQSTRSQNETSRGVSSSAQWNVYDNAGWREPRMRSELALAQAKDRNDQLRKQIRNEAERLKRGFYDQQRQLDISDQNLAVREQRFKVQRARYYNGEISVTEYLEEELRLIEARLGLVQSRIELILAGNQIELGLGLPIDSLNLVQINELNPEEQEQQTERQSGVDGRARSWTPRTELQLPQAPFDPRADLREN